jgi:RNA polymerase sigma factor (sigma-70 family)
MASLTPKLSVIEGGFSAGADLGDVQTAPAHHPESQTEYVEALYKKHHSSLLNYLMHIVPGGLQDANEILQETYIRLLRQQNLDHLEQNARAYIFTIATNLARDSLRRRASRMQDFHVEFDELNHASEEPSPQHVLDWEQSVGRLKAALFELSPLSRRIFLLSRFEQMTYPEIAEKMHISSRTVERHMSCAIKHLQISLEDLL